MAISKTTDITELLPMIYEKARMTILEKPLIRQIVDTFDISGKAGNTITVPRFNTVTADALTEGVDMTTPQTVETTGITLTVSGAGAQTFLTDESTEDASEDVMEKHGTILGDAIAQKDDTDGIALFTTLTPSIGAVGTALGLAAHVGAMTILRAANAVGDPQAVYHPYAYHALATSLLTNSSYGALQPVVDSEIAKRFRAKELMGVTIYESGNIPFVHDASGNDTAAVVNAMFTKGCFGRTNKRSLKIEKERDASLRGWELNATTRYGYALVEEDWGVKIPSAAAAPTV